MTVGMAAQHQRAAFALIPVWAIFKERNFAAWLIVQAGRQAVTCTHRQAPVYSSSYRGAP
jgi:hypothetical protein